MTKAFFDIGPGVLDSEAWDPKWKDFTIIGVEADPERYAQLKETYPGTLLNLAVSDKPGTLPGMKHPGSGFIAHGYPGLTGMFDVKAITLDELDATYGPFDEIAIWADIEGSELRMLKGAPNVLKKVKWMLLELHTSPKTPEWCNSTDVFNFVRELGFVSNENERPQTEYDTHYDIVFTRDI